MALSVFRVGVTKKFVRNFDLLLLIFSLILLKSFKICWTYRPKIALMVSEILFESMHEEIVCARVSSASAFCTKKISWKKKTRRIKSEISGM